MSGFSSSTTSIPDASHSPRHIAIIMDGNGRWAKQRFLPRVAGHKRGVDAVRDMVRTCIDLGVEYLTLFAFSSENWRRPADEVTFLMQLFLRAMEREVEKLHENNIRLKIVGRRDRFERQIVELIEQSEQKTAHNKGLTLTIAADYGGRWDILQASNKVMAQYPGVTEISEEQLTSELAMAYAPEPDLFIRTGGEQRISNFLLWQLAYTEFYFTETLWPDFDAAKLRRAIESFHQRERRFGRTSEQLNDA